MEKMTLDEAIKRHVDVFGVEPVTVDRLRDSMEEINAILQAIDDGEPLDETKTLSDEERATYERGELLF